MIVCSCNVLSENDVRSALGAAQMPRTAGQVYGCLGCSPQCGRCASTIRRIMDEAIAVAWKHRNVWIDTSAHIPKHFPPAFTHFMRTFGRDKCLFASDWSLLPIGRPLAQLDEYCQLPEESRRKFLRDNAVRAFKLDG